MVTSIRGFKEVHLWMEGAAQDHSPELSGRAKDGHAACWVQRIAEPTRLRDPCANEGEVSLR